MSAAGTGASSAEKTASGSRRTALLTIFDLLCDAKPGRHAAGTWRTTLDFGGQVHRGLLENEKPDALELLYDKDPARLRAACETLGGEALPGADVSYALPFFEDLRIAVQFWHGDEEFSPRLRFLWDAAADQYLRYETMYYALSQYGIETGLKDQ